jgi:hypothetical protein
LLGQGALGDLWIGLQRAEQKKASFQIQRGRMKGVRGSGTLPPLGGSHGR